MLPHAREEGLIVQELADETLVYDRESHRAHCLNRAAGLVWRRCDGRTSRGAIAAQVGAALEFAADEAFVQLALRQLGAAGLLRAWPLESGGGGGGRPRCTRREVARRLALAGRLALLLPVVESIVAPTPAVAASCVQSCAGVQNGVTCGPGCLGQCQGGICG
jgi:hypothetical protein